MKLLFHQVRFLVGVFYLALLFTMSIIAPWLLPFDADLVDLSLRGARASLSHPFGCDIYGRDLMSAVFAGAFISLKISLCSVFISTLIGTLLGLSAGFWQGRIDALIMGVSEVLMAFPGILLSLALAALLGPSPSNVIIAIATTGWTSVARLVRGQVLTLVQRDFVTANIALGARPWRTMLRHIFPSLSSLLVINATFSLSGVILIEASLSFLGLSGPINIPTWGALLNQGRAVLAEAPHLSIVPGIFIMSTILAFNQVGDAIRDHLDPKQQKGLYR